MPTFQRCDDSVKEMAEQLARKFECYERLREFEVKIDFVFAYAGEKEISALRKGGVACLGIARKLPLKDRAMGRGDAEIALDGDWWKKAAEEERRALLDHEMYHLIVTGDRDDLGRPQLRLRRHDFDLGWFKVIAERHGLHSQECQQAQVIMESSGQLFWPMAEGKTGLEGGRMSRLEFKLVERR